MVCLPYMVEETEVCTSARTRSVPDPERTSHYLDNVSNGRRDARFVSIAPESTYFVRYLLKALLLYLQIHLAYYPT